MAPVIQQVNLAEPAIEMPIPGKQADAFDFQVSHTENVPVKDDDSGSGAQSSPNTSHSSVPSLASEGYHHNKLNVFGGNDLSLDEGLGHLDLSVQLAELFAENVMAKIWKVAVRELEKEVRIFVYKLFYSSYYSLFHSFPSISRS